MVNQMGDPDFNLDIESGFRDVDDEFYDPSWKQSDWPEYDKPE